MDGGSESRPTGTEEAVIGYFGIHRIQDAPGSEIRCGETGGEWAVGVEYREERTNIHTIGKGRESKIN